ncbi:MAG: ImcF-related family protein [Amaricoccus sp.]
MRDREVPRTVIRPPGPPRSARDDILAGLAAPLLALSAEAARDPRPDPAALAAEARRRTEAFETAALKAGVPRDAVGEARDAVLAVLEARARANPALSSKAWARARRKALPGVPDPDADDLRRRRAAAEAAGPTRRELARFLRHCEEAVAAAPPAREPSGLRWGLIAPLAVVVALAGWAGFAEWRFSEGLLAGFPATDPAAASDPAAAARSLDAMKAAVEDISLKSAGSPLGLAPHLGRFAPGAVAQQRYVAAVDALLPSILATALDFALANEGGSLQLYDTLRTRAILDGTAPWQPGFVAGWVEDRKGADATLGALAPHAAALSGPPRGFPTPDAEHLELLGQARGIAADGDPAAFAFLELARDDAARALPGWSPSILPDLDAVLVRHSGNPLSQAIPGLYTAAGWRWAAGGGARAAIDRAASLRARVLGTTAPAEVTEGDLLAVLQDRTIAAWNDELADLRVRPFIDQKTSLLVSGILGADSPLDPLFRDVWHQAGGDDRSRGYVEQTKVTTSFGPMFQFVDQGGMAEIEQVFAGLNVALAAVGSDAEVSHRRLMDVRHRATSIATLNQAPRLVVQIVEDVLAQSTAAREGGGQPQASLTWQRELSAACRAALTGRYPFAADGPDADLAAVAAFLGPNGTVAHFLASDLAPLIDTTTDPWTWKPEARLSGFDPDSAVFLDRAAVVGDALFPPDGQTALTLSALAQRGTATVTLGGVQVPIEASGAPSTLSWPGPSPDQGLAIAFTGAGPGAEQAWRGPWGLLRFLGSLHLRARDDGRRFLVDVRLADTRAYLDLAFARPSNPAAARAAMTNLACPASL